MSRNSFESFVRGLGARTGEEVKAENLDLEMLSHRAAAVCGWSENVRRNKLSGRTLLTRAEELCLNYYHRNLLETDAIQMRLFKV